MATKKSLLVTVVIALVLVVSARYFLKGEESSQASTPTQQRETVVAIVEVATEMVSDRIESVGTLVANESVTITAQVSDPIRKIHFDDGQYVEEGDVLVELTNYEESAQLAEAQANLDDSERQLKRLETLGGSVASQSQIDEARARYNANKGKLDAIVARIDQRLIRAPFSGVLGFRQISPGTLVTTSTPITTLDDVATLNLDFSVAETFLQLVRPGSLIKAKSPSYPNEIFEGNVQTLGSRVDPVTRTLSVRAGLSNDEGKLRPGMLMSIELWTQPVEKIVIPEAALILENDIAYVYEVNPQETIERRLVEVGERRPGAVVIESGLIGGERIVTEGTDAVRPNLKVKIVNPDGSPLSEYKPIVDTEIEKTTEDTNNSANDSTANNENRAVKSYSQEDLAPTALISNSNTANI